MCNIAKPLVGQFSLHRLVSWLWTLGPSMEKLGLTAYYSISLQFSTLIVIIRWDILYIGRQSSTLYCVSLLFKTLDWSPMCEIGYLVGAKCYKNGGVFLMADTLLDPRKGYYWQGSRCHLFKLEGKKTRSVKGRNTNTDPCRMSLTCFRMNTKGTLK